MRAALALLFLWPILDARAECPAETAPFGSQEYTELVLATLRGEPFEFPLQAPAADKLGAASRTGDSTDLVDEPQLPGILGLALDNGLVATDDGQLTVGLNLFAFKTLGSPEILDRQSLYGRYELLRRFGGTLSLGGKGESFDRDGDGVADPALEVEAIDDIVNWDVQHRFFGSRDRRDATNSKRILEAGRLDFDTAFSLLSKLTQPMNEAFKNKQCVGRGDIEGFLEDNDKLEDVRKLREMQASSKDKTESALKAVDGSTVLTLVLGGTSREPQFGPDRRSVAFRGVWGLGEEKSSNGTVNLEWTESEGASGAPDPETIKLGLQFSTFLLRNRIGLEEGIKASIAGAVELNDNVPDVAHENIAKLNVRLEIPLRDGITLPLSVTWANHRDLLTEESDIRGNIGFTFNFSPGQLLKGGED